MTILGTENEGFFDYFLFHWYDEKRLISLGKKRRMRQRILCERDVFRLIRV